MVPKNAGALLREQVVRVRVFSYRHCKNVSWLEPALLSFRMGLIES